MVAHLGRSDRLVTNDIADADRAAAQNTVDKHTSARDQLSAVRRGGRRGGTTLFWVIAAALPLAFLTLFFVWPVVSLVVMGLTDYGGLTLAGIADVFAQTRTQRVITQTLIQAMLGTAVSLVLGIPAAFVLYRLDFRGRTLLRGLATVPFVLPTVVVAVAFTALFGPGSALAWLGLDQSLGVIVLAFAFFNVTVVARIVGAFWSQLDERQEQAARMLGASGLRVWCTVTLPTLAPAIASAESLVFLFCATSFGVVLILGGRQFANIETEIYRLAVDFLDLRSAALLSLAQFALVALVLVISSRTRARRERAVGMQFDDHGRISRPIRPGRQHVLAIAVFALTTLVLHALPIVTLVLRSLRQPDGSYGFAHYVNLIAPVDGVNIGGLASSTVFDAVLNSLGLALIATSIALPLGVLVSLVASRRPRHPLLRQSVSAFDGFIMLPLGVSAVTLGFGLLITMHRPLGIGFDLRTSVILIPIAQALVALPLVVRTMLPALRAIDPRLRDAAALLGASPLRVLATVDVPMLGRSAGLALGFAFATSLGEFGASAFLVRPGAQTLPVVIASLAGRQGAEAYGMALAAAVLLGAITATVMLVAERLRGGSVGEW